MREEANRPADQHLQGLEAGPFLLLKHRLLVLDRFGLEHNGLDGHGLMIGGTHTHPW